VKSPELDRSSVDTRTSEVRTLAIDIGGTHVKAAVLDEKGGPLTDRMRIDTPIRSRPDSFVAALVRLAAPLSPFDRVSVGFCGFVRDGRVLTAPNLSSRAWAGFDLAKALARQLDKPVRVANDADIQGLGVVSGKGVEMVITLGTGFGTGLFVCGRLAPHLEIAHQPFRKGQTYDEQLGNAARVRVGNRAWNNRVRKAIRNMRELTLFDHLYVGGGNSKKISLELDPDVTIVSNTAGITGGVALWREH